MGGKIIISDSYLITIATQHNYNLIIIEDEEDAKLVPDRFILHFNAAQGLASADNDLWVRVVLARALGGTALDITGTNKTFKGKQGEEVIAMHTQRVTHDTDGAIRSLNLYWDFKTRRELEQNDAIVLSSYAVGTSGTLPVSLDANIMWE